MWQEILLVLLGILLGGLLAFLLMGWCMFRRIAHIETGEQRRALYPIDVPLSTGSEQVMQAPDLQLKRSMLSLKDGSQMFYQVVRAKNKVPTHACIFLHGYQAHSDLMLHFAAEWARKGAVVLLPDLPCHGRSDGRLMLIMNWWTWVDQIFETIDLMVAENLSGPTTLTSRAHLERGRLPIFISGGSLGGGVAACLCLQRPTFFRGALLMAPMLTVKDDVKPPWLVQKFFKNVVAALLPTWPITPVKELTHFDFRIPEHGVELNDNNPLSLLGLKPRLGTGLEFGFTYPDWLEENMEDFRTPFIIMHGAADKITDPSTSKMLVEEAETKDKLLKLYDGVFHAELFCCLPGSSEGIEWTAEEIEATRACLSDGATWMAQRI